MIKCPKCGNVSEVEVELEIGQHLICPYCSEKFAYSEPAPECAVVPEQKLLADSAQVPLSMPEGLRFIRASTNGNGNESADDASEAASPLNIHRMKLAAARMSAKIKKAAMHEEGINARESWNLLWWLGNVLLTVWFGCELVQLVDANTAAGKVKAVMSSFGSAISNDATGVLNRATVSSYLILFCKWFLGYLANWSGYKIAVGVSASEARRRTEGRMR